MDESRSHCPEEWEEQDYISWHVFYMSYFFASRMLRFFFNFLLSYENHFHKQTNKQKIQLMPRKHLSVFF